MNRRGRGRGRGRGRSSESSEDGGSVSASRLSVVPDWFCLFSSQRSYSGTHDNTTMDMMLDDSFSALLEKST